MVTECEARPFSIGVDGVSITVKYEHALDGKKDFLIRPLAL